VQRAGDPDREPVRTPRRRPAGDQRRGRPTGLEVAREPLDQARRERRAVVVAPAGLLQEVLDHMLDRGSGPGGGGHGH
jgi:hypothetical protein